MSTEVYTPPTSLAHRVGRRVTPLLAQRRVAVALDRPVLSFTFDDAPTSVLDTALPLLEARGWAATVYIATGLMGTTNHHGRMMDGKQIAEVHARGHEIAAHSHEHRNQALRPTADVMRSIDESHRVLADIGIPDAVSYAWPYGQARPSLKRALAERYTSLRGIGQRTHRRAVDLNQVGSWKLFTGRGVERVMDELDRLEARPGWMTVFTHDVRENCSEWGCTPAELERVAERVAEMDVDVLPVARAVERLA